MKKKFTLILLTLVCVIACVFGLAACGGNKPNNDIDKKASQNAEFVSFRKAVTTILKDNNVFVNDYDNPSSAKERNATSSNASLLQTKQAMAYAESKQSRVSDQDKQRLIDTIKRGERGNDENHLFAQKQIFTMALKLPLLVGDGISTYHNEKKFFDIVVCFQDQFENITSNHYTKVSNSGSVFTILCYAPPTENCSTLVNISIDFKSDNDYSFAFVQRNDYGATEQESAYSSIFYAYGNSQQEFICIYKKLNRDAATEDPYAMYSPSGQDYYFTETAQNSSAIVNDCYNLIKNEIPTDYSPYTALENQTKYKITPTQQQELKDKYFKDMQPTTEPNANRDGVFYETVGGQEVAMYYKAMDGQSQVVIPLVVDVISAQFRVYDKEGNVNSLFIPKSVKKIIDTDGREASASEFRLSLEDQYGNSQRSFTNITVEQGSPLFRAGSGNLVTNDGKIAYLLDNVQDEWDFNVLAKMYRERNGTEITYKNATTVRSSEINIDYAEMCRTFEKYGINANGDYDVFRLIEKVINNSSISTINVTLSPVARDPMNPEASKEAYLSLNLSLKRDLTVNVTYPAQTVSGWGSSSSLGLYLSLTNDTGVKRNVTVNAIGFSRYSGLSVVPKQPDYEKGEEPVFVPNPMIFTTFNFDMPQWLFEELNLENGLGDTNNSTTNRTGDWSAWDGWDGPSLGVAENIPDNSVLTIPDAYPGTTISQQLMVDLSRVENKAVKIIVPKNMDVEFISNEIESFCNENFVLQYEDLMLSEIDEKFANMKDGGLSMQFTVIGKDGSKLMRLGWKFSPNNPENPDNWQYSATVNVFGETKTLKFRGDNGHRTTLLQSAQNNYAYFLVSEADGSLLELTFDYLDGSNRGGERRLYAQFTPEHNGKNFTLYKFAAKNPGSETGEAVEAITQSYTLRGEDYNLTVTVAFWRRPNEWQAANWATISNVTGTIGGQTVKYSRPSSYSYNQVGEQVIIYVGEQGAAQQTYYLRVTFSNDGLRLLKLKSVNLLEVELHVGTQTVKRDFTRDEKYRFTADSLPNGNYDYYVVYNNVDAPAGVCLLPKDDDGYYFTPYGEGRYDIARVERGENTWVVSGDSYNLTITWTAKSLEANMSAFYVEFFQIVSVVGSVNGKTVNSTDSKLIRPETPRGEISYYINFQDGTMFCTFYVENFTIKLQVLNIFSRPSDK